MIPPFGTRTEIPRRAKPIAAQRIRPRLLQVEVTNPATSASRCPPLRYSRILRRHGPARVRRVGRTLSGRHGRSLGLTRATHKIHCGRPLDELRLCGHAATEVVTKNCSAETSPDLSTVPGSDRTTDANAAPQQLDRGLSASRAAHHSEVSAPTCANPTQGGRSTALRAQPARARAPRHRSMPLSGPSSPLARAIRATIRATIRARVTKPSGTSQASAWITGSVVHLEVFLLGGVRTPGRRENFWAV